MVLSHSPKYLSTGAIIITAFILPAILGRSFATEFLIMTGIWVIFAISLRLIMTVGLVSFAHAGFLAIGAYTSAVLTMKVNLSFWLAMPLAGTAAGLVGLIIGYPMLRTKGHYFFLSSFALGMVIILTFSTQLREVFGGTMGIANIPYPSPRFSHPVAHYYLTLFMTILSMIILHRIDKSRIGIEWRAIREVDDLAALVGINIVHAKLRAFVMACFLAGIAGSLWAHYIRFISPDAFMFPTMLLCLTMVIVGGMYSTWGPVVGAFLLRSVIVGVGGLKEWEILIYSALLVICITLIPRGVVSIPERVRLLLSRSVMKVGSHIDNH